MSKNTEKMNVAEAIETVGGNREYIHCFTNPRGMLVGADWSWQRFEELLDGADRVELAGAVASRMNHPLAVFAVDRWYFFESITVA